MLVMNRLTFRQRVDVHVVVVVTRSLRSSAAAIAAARAASVEDEPVYTPPFNTVPQRENNQQQQQEREHRPTGDILEAQRSPMDFMYYPDPMEDPVMFERLSRVVGTNSSAADRKRPNYEVRPEVVFSVAMACKRFGKGDMFTSAHLTMLANLFGCYFIPPLDSAKDPIRAFAVEMAVLISGPRSRLRPTVTPTLVNHYCREFYLVGAGKVNVMHGTSQGRFFSRHAWAKYLDMYSANRELMRHDQRLSFLEPWMWSSFFSQHVLSHP